MSIVTSNVFQGSDFFKADLIASTADLTANINHGLGAIKAAAGSGIGGLAPLDVTLTPLHADYYLSQWLVTAINTTLVTVVKRSQSLSGGAAAQAKLIVRRPHSIGR
jgi:hypothetical protein